MKSAPITNLFVGGLLAAVMQTAFCQGTVYSSRSAFESALISSTTVTFEEDLILYPPPPTPGLIGFFSITASGVTFTNPAALLTIDDSLSPIPGGGKYLWNFDGGFPVTVLLPEGMTAFGADFSGGIEPNPSFNATWTVNLFGGGSYAYDFSAPRGSWAFFGVTFAEPIASLVYRDAGPPDGVMGGPLHEEILDNVTFGVVPEPAVSGVFTLGALVLGWRFYTRPKPCNSEDHKFPPRFPLG